MLTRPVKTVITDLSRTLQFMEVWEGPLAAGWTWQLHRILRDAVDCSG